jgi:hypothetical protein
MQLSKEFTTVTPLSKALALALFILLPILGFSLGMNFQSVIQNEIKSPSQPPVACTMDAKICPDGTSVGRTAPSCAFAACPTTPTKGKKFTGEITSINYGCHTDGTCSLGIGKAGVIVAKGESLNKTEPVGSFPSEILDVKLLNTILHKQVEVYAASVGGRTDSYTLFGDKSYYVKFTNLIQTTCGGIAGKLCSAGYYCKYDGTYPDAAGTCIKNAPTTTKYTCPESEYVDCMPPIGIKKTECSSAFLQWATENCPGFQGAAY